MEEKKKDSLSIVVFTDDYDKVMAALVMATGAKATGWDVTLYFTFWGLNLITKKKLSGKYKRNIIQKLFGIINKPTVDNSKLSKFNFGGIGKGMLEILLKQKKIPTLKELFDYANQLGVKIVACSLAMSVFGLSKEDLEDFVKEIVDVPEYLRIAKESSVAHFIA